jgi:aldehyde dehydrogenase (NAD+)
MFIDGERITTRGETLTKVDPSTGQTLAEIPSASRADIDDAVASASVAFPKWRAMPADARRQVLLRIAALLREHDAEFSLIASLETGVPYRPGAAYMTADFYEYYAGWVDKSEGLLVPTYPADGLAYVRNEPFGVVAALLAWNGPIGACGLKIAAALAAGNCVVVKPSELGPLAPVRFAELCAEAGLPPGVLNLVQGGPAVGDALVRHAGVAKVTFTGGIGIGRQILATAAPLGKPVVLELGGKSANLIFADADLDRAITGAAAAVTANAGQVCLKPSRLLVERSVYADVVEGVVEQVEKTIIGDPLHPATTMGPVISEMARDRVVAFVESAVGAGDGQLLTGAGRLGADLVEGYFVRPAVFADVDNATALAQSECFGPVLAIMPFGHEDEAVALANDTSYGLAAYVQTRDVTRAHRIARALDAGQVNINGLMSVRASAPFGGFKASGLGREGGAEGFMEFLQSKHVQVHF